MWCLLVTFITRIPLEIWHLSHWYNNHQSGSGFSQWHVVFWPGSDCICYLSLRHYKLAALGKALADVSKLEKMLNIWHAGKLFYALSTWGLALAGWVLILFTIPLAVENVILDLLLLSRSRNWKACIDTLHCVICIIYVIQFFYKIWFLCIILPQKSRCNKVLVSRKTLVLNLGLIFLVPHPSSISYHPPPSSPTLTYLPVGKWKQVIARPFHPFIQPMNQFCQR